MQYGLNTGTPDAEGKLDPFNDLRKLAKWILIYFYVFIALTVIVTIIYGPS